MTPHSGPAFLDFPMDHVFSEAPEPEDAAGRCPTPPPGRRPTATLERAVALLREAERPVIMAGTDLYWGHGEERAARAGRGAAASRCSSTAWRAAACPPTTSCSSRARAGPALKGADVALVIGVPMDFRLGFGGSFGEETEIVVVDRAEPAARASARGGRRALRRRCPRPRRAALGRRRRRRTDDARVGRATLRAHRDREARGRARRAAPTTARRCTRCALYGELGEVLDRDAIVIGDGGDFVSYAGRVIDSYEPGCWLDPGPFGCLGSGPGYALAAKLAHPDRQVVLLLGDGAFGFSGMEFDTLARHGVNVVGVMGNNGIWALEKHPMEFLYGYSVAAELRPETRYDQVVEALGGHGELVRDAGRAAPGARAGVRGGQAGAGQRADRPDRRLSAAGRTSPESPRNGGSRPRRAAS